MVASANASNSVAAVLSKKDDSEEVAAFDKMVRGCRPIPRHRQKRPLKRHQGATRLFTLTTLAASDRYGGTRCVAVYDNFKFAQRCVLKNCGDIWETTYDLAVIEVIHANSLYGGFTNEQYWYRWNRRKKGYEPIERPDRYKQTVGFGVG